MSSIPAYPPMDGSLTLSGLVDFNAQNNPTHPLFVYSETPETLTEIYFLEFACASHRIGHIIRPGRIGPEAEVVALIANTDSLLYEALFSGMMRAGIVVSRMEIKIIRLKLKHVQPFPISPKNSAEALVSMIIKSGCHRALITHKSLGQLLHEVQTLLPTEFSLIVQEIPTLAQCFPHLGREVEKASFVPYPACQEGQTPDDPLFYLHSSGSTGFPKPILQTENIMLGWCRAGELVVYCIN